MKIMKKILKPLLALSLGLFFMGCTDKNAIDIAGSWKTSELVVGGVVQTLVVSEMQIEKKTGDNFSVTGNSGVNSFFGTVTATKDSFKASENFGSTKMAGEPEAMDFEDLFLNVLLHADSVEVVNNQLIIKNKADNSQITFVKE